MECARACVRPRGGTSAVGGREGKNENGGNARTTTRIAGSEGDNKRDGIEGVRAETRIQTDRKEREKRTSIGENDWDGANLLYKNDDKLCACTVDIAIDVCLLKLLSLSLMMSILMVDTNGVDRAHASQGSHCRH